MAKYNFIYCDYTAKDVIHKIFTRIVRLSRIMASERPQKHLSSNNIWGQTNRSKKRKGKMLRKFMWRVDMGLTRRGRTRSSEHWNSFIRISNWPSTTFTTYTKYCYINCCKLKPPNLSNFQCFASNIEHSKLEYIRRSMKEKEKWKKHLSTLFISQK